MAIPLLDTLIIQTQDRLYDEYCHARHLLYLVPSIIVNNTLKVSEATEGIFHFPNPLGISCEDSKLCGSQRRRNFQAIFYSHLPRVMRMLFQKSIVVFSLHVPYQSVMRKLSSPFAHEMDQDVHQINDK